MKCKKCNSENVIIQRISITKNKKKGLLYWLFFGWLIDLALFVILTIPFIFAKVFFPKKTKTSIRTEAVCQDCGYVWRVRGNRKH